MFNPDHSKGKDMNIVCDCRFCDIKNGIYAYPGVDNPIFRSDEYYLMTSIGAIVAGWSLLVPHEHCYSMRAHYCQKSFITALNDILYRYMIAYDSVVLFEHGANAQDSLTSCGTSHAHLHIIPNISIKNEIMNSKLTWHKCSTKDISMISNDNEYLYYVEIKKNDSFTTQTGICHILDEPQSQFFRKIICKK